MSIEYTIKKYSDLNEQFKLQYMESHLAAFRDNLPISWFDWKFRLCENDVFFCIAYDNKKIVGCNAYSIVRFCCNKRSARVAVVRDTFVHPNYHRMGIFSNILDKVEKYAKESGIDFLLIYPNANSKQGVLKRGWEQSSIPLRNYVKFLSARSYVKIASLRKIFCYLKPSLHGDELPYNFSYDDSCRLIFSGQYIHSRLTASPYASYAHIKINNSSYIFRIGTRGDLNEANLLLWSNLNLKDMKAAFRKLQRDYKIDIVTSLLSDNIPEKTVLLKLLFVPIRSHITPTAYSATNRTTEPLLSKMKITGFDFHTY